jgi:nucleoporin SEH1
VIHKLSWANPCFGNLLASCSFDKTVIIWTENAEKGEGTLSISPLPESHWKQVLQIGELKERVMDVKFSPHRDKLILAACTSRGTIYVWTPKDMLNLLNKYGQCELI